MPAPEVIKVLLIEDNPYDAKIVEELLAAVKDEKFSLREAEDLSSARAAEKSDPADIVLLDLNLPDSYGQDTLLKSIDIFPGRPIIVMTGRFEERLGVQMIKKGAQDYIVKGKLSAEGLNYAIRYAIERAATERRLKEEEENLRGLLEELADGVLVVGESGEVLFANRAAERLLAHSRNHITAAPYGLPRAADSPVETDLVRHDGKKIPLEIRETPIRWRGLACRMVALRDLTAVRQLEYNRGEFISVVSHELRSPLTVVRETLDMIGDGTAGEPSEKQKEAAAMGLEVVGRLNRLIDSLIDISRMEAGVMPLDLRENDLSLLIAGTAAESGLLGKEKGVSVEFVHPDGPVPAFCDQDKIRQVLANLASNALKFTPRGGRITFSVKKWERQALLCVENTGPGIAQEDLPRLFGKFSKLDSRRGGPVSGTGLGLAISRGIMEMHGGRLWAESEPDNYTRFFALLPGRDFEETARAMVEREINHGTGKKGFCAVAVKLPEDLKGGGSADICLALKNALRSSHGHLCGGGWDLITFLPGAGLKECARSFAFVQKVLEKSGVPAEQAAAAVRALSCPEDFTDPEGFLAGLRGSGGSPPA